MVSNVGRFTAIRTLGTYFVRHRYQSEEANVSHGMFRERGGWTYRMDPEPGAVAAALRALREVGDVEGGVLVPNTGVVDGENGEVVGLDIVHVGLVRDSKRTTLHVVDAGGVEGRSRGADTGRVTAVADVSTKNMRLR